MLEELKGLQEKQEEMMDKWASVCEGLDEKISNRFMTHAKFLEMCESYFSDQAQQISSQHQKQLGFFEKENLVQHQVLSRSISLQSHLHKDRPTTMASARSAFNQTLTLTITTFESKSKMQFYEKIPIIVRLPITIPHPTKAITTHLLESTVSNHIPFVADLLSLFPDHSIYAGFMPITRRISDIPLQTNVSVDSCNGNRLHNPYGLAVHPLTGHIFVTDGHSLVHEFSADFKPIKSHGQSGTADGQFRDPRGICVSPKGRIVVVEYSNKRFQLFDSQFNHIVTVSQFDKSSFNGCVNAAFDIDENIYIADEYNERVVKFDPSGNFLCYIGDRNSLCPAGYADALCINGSGELFVYPRAGDTVYVYEASTGEHLRSFRVGKAQANWNYMTRSADDGFVLCEYNRGLVHFHDRMGVNLMSIKQANAIGAGFMSNGSLAVVSRDSSKILVY